MILDAKMAKLLSIGAVTEDANTCCELKIFVVVVETKRELVRRLNEEIVLGKDVRPPVPKPATVDVSCDVDMYPAVANPATVDVSSGTSTKPIVVDKS